VVPLGRLDVTDYGGRADYRARRRKTVLEISGTEVPAELGRRHRDKVVQARDNPFGWDAYMVVCAFSAEGHRIRLPDMHSRRPNVPKAKRSLALVEELLAEKSAILSQAQALTAMGMGRSAQPQWAAALEERIARALCASGEELEASAPRISAAACYEKAGHPSRAINLYRAAFAGPLRDVTRNEVEEMLAACLVPLKGSPPHTKSGKAETAS